MPDPPQAAEKQDEQRVEEVRARLGRPGGPAPFLDPGELPGTIWRCPACGHLTAEEGSSTCGYCLAENANEAGDIWQPYTPASSLATANQQIEAMEEQVAALRDEHDHESERAEDAEARIEELTRERDEAKKLAEFYIAHLVRRMDGSKWRRDFLRRAEEVEAQVNETQVEGRTRTELMVERQTEVINLLCGLAEEKQAQEPELAERIWDIASILELPYPPPDKEGDEAQ